MRMVEASSPLISQTHLSSDSVPILLSGWGSTWKPAKFKNISRAPFVLRKHDFLVLLTYFSEPSYLLGRMEADLISKCKVTMGNYDSMIKATGIVALCRNVRHELAICNSPGVETVCHRTRGVSYQQRTSIFVWPLFNPTPCLMRTCNSSSF